MKHFLSTIIIYAVSIQLLTWANNVKTVTANDEASSTASSSSSSSSATCANDDNENTITTHRRNEHLMPASSIPGEIDYIRWKNGTILDNYAAQITLPPLFTEKVLKYCEEAGITDMYRRVFFPSLQESNNDNNDNNNNNTMELQPNSDSSFISNDGMNWYLQRPGPDWNSNMHWLSCNDKAAADKYMQVLGEAGFDVVLDALGNFFNLDGIDCYSVGFIGVTKCRKTYIHADFQGVQGKAFNILIPLLLVEGSDPEFVVLTKDNDIPVPIHYEYNTALVVGDYTSHGTGIVDYVSGGTDGTGTDTGFKNFRMGLSVYVADTNKENVDIIIQDYTDPYPPASAKYLLKRAGKHWKKDGSVRLAKPPEERMINPDGTILLDSSDSDSDSEEEEGGGDYDYDYSNEEAFEDQDETEEM